MKKTALTIIKFAPYFCMLVLSLVACTTMPSSNHERIPISIEESKEGAPITMGIPFPQGALLSTDQVRLLDSKGKEIPCQVTEVTSWEPVDFSVKWVWVFFFATEDDSYQLEYGEGVSRAPLAGPTIKFKNSQRSGLRGFAEIDTGPLSFKVAKGVSGFMESVHLDVADDDVQQKDTIATSPQGRGSFLDMLDDAGIDPSKAVITRTVREKGSGPLHAILRIEGHYEYERADNPASPFIIRIHAYAGKSYVRVFHTMTYTGEPDKHKERPGAHPAIATGDSDVWITEDRSEDEGWLEPNDRIESTGLSMHYRFEGTPTYRAAYHQGKWYEPGEVAIASGSIPEQGILSIFQTGPKPTRVPPLPNSDGEKRIDGFEGKVLAADQAVQSFERAAGWMDVSDDKWGVAIGMRYFFEEYPKDLSFDASSNNFTAHAWSPKAGPMSFERANLRSDAGLLDNYATGTTKTTEMVYHFHEAGIADQEIAQVMNFILDPPTAHAAPEVYANSQVYGQFAPYRADHEEFERGLEYKFDWIDFNTKWEPWYGMLDHGDHMRFFFNGDWRSWTCNEPAVDYMYWLQYMRTGNRKYYMAAEAASRHSMDVDNIHWPAKKPYIGDTNEAYDFWVNDKGQEATPYLGVGKRHANQHYSALLSAHVWVTGWVASYYLTGYHRGLDIARLSADAYTRRIWGDHGLTGRRLYLSVWNLVEVWDATKDETYKAELDDRVDRMLRLQAGPDQYNSLVMDRYGYSQGYVSQGLRKYYQLTQDEKIKHAVILHAKALRDNPGWNHEYESYFASISGLVLGYEMSGEKSLLDEAIKRAEQLKTDPLEKSFEELGTQKEIALALEEASKLPGAESYAEGSGWNATIWGMTMGLRIFGWTHIYNVPWLLEHIDDGS
jgi:hypothetical protein